MLSTLSSSSSPYSHNRNNPPFSFYQKPFTISKSSSNTQLNKVDKFARKHSSSYALNYYDGNSVEMPKSDDSHGLKCHHMSTINLAKVNPQIFKNNKPNEACNKNNHTDIQSCKKTLFFFKDFSCFFMLFICVQSLQTANDITAETS